MNEVENSPDTVESFNVGELIALYQENSASRNNLWGLYVAATFAASGFVTASDDVGTIARIAMSFGFLAFTIGHGFILYRVSLIRLGMQEILSRIKNHPLQPIIKNISYNQSHKTKISFALIPHVIIDVVVLTIIWSYPLCVWYLAADQC